MYNNLQCLLYFFVESCTSVAKIKNKVKNKTQKEKKINLKNKL